MFSLFAHDPSLAVLGHMSGSKVSGEVGSSHRSLIRDDVHYEVESAMMNSGPLLCSL